METENNFMRAEKKLTIRVEQFGRFTDFIVTVYTEVFRICPSNKKLVYYLTGNGFAGVETFFSIKCEKYNDDSPDVGAVYTGYNGIRTPGFCGAMEVYLKRSTPFSVNVIAMAAKVRSGIYSRILQAGCAQVWMQLRCRPKDRLWNNYTVFPLF